MTTAAAPILNPQLFSANLRSLESPTVEELLETLNTLPRRGMVEISADWTARLELLHALESYGTFAITVFPQPGFDRVLITAYKGKTGACYETGRSAIYHGSGSAALDDDGHLLAAGSVRVCEKTGGNLSLPPYQAVVRITAADPAQLQRLDTDPIPFDCNTFMADAQRVAAGFTAPCSCTCACNATKAVTPKVAVLYPGPFRLLIAPDGSILRRGVVVQLDQTTAQPLAASDALVMLPAELADGAAVPGHYPSLYATAGAGCLMSSLCAGAPTADSAPVRQEAPATLTPPAKLALLSASEELQQKLLALIDRAQPYLILTGSDPAEAGGCCPCDAVGEANRLVAAGVLARYSPPAAPGACTAAFYAFAGEITTATEPPVFTPNVPLRSHVRPLLNSQGIK